MKRKVVIAIAFIILLGFALYSSSPSLSPVSEKSIQKRGFFDRTEIRYVDPNNGNDANNGKTTETAWKTLERSASYSNQHTEVPVTIQLLNGVYEPFDFEIEERSAWARYVGEGKSEIPFIKLINAGDAYLSFENVYVTSASPGVSGDYNGITLYKTNYVQIHDSIISSSHVESKNPEINSYGIRTREATGITLHNNVIKGSRYGVNLWTDDSEFVGNEVYGQFGDGVRVVSAQNVLIKNNKIHDITDTYGTGEHIDAIQFFPAGPAGEYPQPKNVKIINNQIYNMSGQMILIQANWIDQIGYIENIELRGNTLAKKTEEDAAVPIQIQGVKNFLLDKNTVDGKVLIRRESEGMITNNIFGELTYTEDSVIHEEDYNILGSLTIDTPYAPELGEHSIIDEPAFLDPKNNDYQPLSDYVCVFSSGQHAVGSVPCECLSQSPRSLFAISEREALINQELLFNAKPSITCDGKIVEYSFSFDDGSTSEESVTSHTYQKAGLYSPQLKITDTYSNTDSYNAQIQILPEKEEYLLVYYPAADTQLDFSHNELHATWFGTEQYETEAFKLDGQSYLKIPYDESLSGMNELTLSVKAKRDSVEMPASLVHKHVTYLARLTGDLFQVSLGTDGSFTSFVVQAPTDDQWHQYAFTYGSGLVKLYIDGELINSFSHSGDIIVGEPSWPVTIGKHSVSDTDYLNGAIDEVRIYNKELTEEEIVMLHEI